MSSTLSQHQANIRFHVEPGASTDLSNSDQVEATYSWPTKTISRWQIEIYQTEEGYLIRQLSNNEQTSAHHEPLSRRPLTFLPHGGIIQLSQSHLCLAIIDPTASTHMTKMADDEPAKRSTGVQIEPGIFFNPESNQFLVDHQPIQPTIFTAIEHDLLKYFYENRERACPYYTIGKAVWKGWVRKATIVKTVSNLRKKLNKICPGSGTRYLLTCRGHQPGYLLTVPS